MAGSQMYSRGFSKCGYSTKGRIAKENAVENTDGNKEHKSTLNAVAFILIWKELGDLYNRRTIEFIRSSKGERKR